MFWSGLGALLMGVAVMLGAFGAHALRDRLDAHSLDIYQRAVLYHFIHAIGLLTVPLLVRAEWISQSIGGWVCLLLLAGILLFSGSLYALAVTGARVLGAVTPLGGLAFILAWLLLAFVLVRASLIR